MRIYRNKRGFTLLEVIVALAILVMSMGLLIQSQSNAALMTYHASHYVTATNLAQEKYAEVRFRMEEEGFTDMDIEESGDFDEFGDEATDIEFGTLLKDYHWAYRVEEIDLAMAGDIAGMAQDYGDGMNGESDGGSIPPTADVASPMQGMLGGDMMSDMLGKYIRQIEVVVWWGDENEEDSVKAGDAITLSGHVINPNGVERELTL